MLAPPVDGQLIQKRKMDSCANTGRVTFCYALSPPCRTLGTAKPLGTWTGKALSARRVSARLQQLRSSGLFCDPYVANTNLEGGHSEPQQQTMTSLVTS